MVSNADVNVTPGKMTTTGATSGYLKTSNDAASFQVTSQILPSEVSGLGVSDPTDAGESYTGNVVPIATIQTDSYGDLQRYVGNGNRFRFVPYTASSSGSTISSIAVTPDSYDIGAYSLEGSGSAWGSITIDYSSFNYSVILRFTLYCVAQGGSVAFLPYAFEQLPVSGASKLNVQGYFVWHGLEEELSASNLRAQVVYA